MEITDSKLAELLKNGAVGVLPTDTLYGVVCAAQNQVAAQRLYALKQRDNKPGTVIAASIDQLEELGFKRRYLTAVERFWPNSLSIIIPCGEELTYIHCGLHSIAVRIPKDLKLQALLAQTGPLLTSSANITGQPAATTIDQAKKYFQDESDFYIDGGDLSQNKPSTIIRVIDDAIEIVREGAVKIDEAGRITT
jgi:L-threonylcarbamoyladenylate synthase